MTIVNLIKRSSQWFSDRIAVVFDQEKITYREFILRTNCLSNGLLNLGLRQGDHVAILMGNTIHMMESQFALAFGGLVWVKLNPRTSLQECLHILNDSESKAILLGREYGDILKEISKDLKYIKHIIFDGPPVPGWENYEALVSSSASSYPKIEVRENDLYSIRYSSGTTGEPKGILHSERARMTSLINVILDTPLNEQDTMLHASPLSHGSALYFLECFVKGGKNVILNKFDPLAFFAAVAKEKVTMTYVVPTMIYMLLESKDLQDYDLSSLKRIVYAASPIAPLKLKEAIQKFGNIFHQIYGMSEAPNVITSLRKEEHLLAGNEAGDGLLCSAGRPSLLSDVKIVGPDHRDVKPGEVGEVCIRSTQLMERYWKLPRETEEKLRGDWFLTGDMGRIDENGYLYIVDRKNDMIISGGLNIYPSEVENAIFQHPGVLECAVIGIPDEKWGEAVQAFVVLKENRTATEEEVIRFCRSKIANYKKPHRVEFVECLPKNSLGKVLRRELRAKYWHGHRRLVH